MAGFAELRAVSGRLYSEWEGVSEILCGRVGFCVFCKIPRLLSDSKSGIANSLNFRGDSRCPDLHRISDTLVNLYVPVVAARALLLSTE
jgi:hypothetical protein